MKYITTKTAVAVIALCLLAGAAYPEKDKSYEGQQVRMIKALSEDDIYGLRNAHGMGLAKAVELNHYPGPKHVLELAEELGLNDKQKQAAEDLFEEMKEFATDVGEKIIEAEDNLDELCATGIITDKELQKRLEKLGKLQGKLRYAHMRAHLQMKTHLTAEQVALYDHFRGYGE